MSNRLKHATSPYLQQHADNPVDWWEWGPEALRAAREQDKPILLSIGYSACHWCHVMAHESFEDEQTAARMNALFINIKVDREERPDLDQIYQTAHQLLAQRPGGWPLTVFLTPDDHAPFFAGTYFPPTPRHRLPAFRDLLRHISDAWEEQRDAIREQNQALLDALKEVDSPSASTSELNSAPLDLARRALAQQFDTRHGGFGKAPKFPHPSNLERLLHHWAASGDQAALEMVDFTLERMASGGLNDQLGGGFCRYSVDDYWMIPHFEKMLYDNGPLFGLYADAWRATGRPLFTATARHTAAWVMREMQSPEGGYYSSLDADSEGAEGRFYIWTPKQAEALLDAPEYAVAALHWGLDRPANFEDAWHLHVFVPLAEVAERLGIPLETARQRLESAREKLFLAREQRIRPGRDDKILTAWNALMISGMARAGRLLDDAAMRDSASRALQFIRERLWDGERLLATSKDGKAHLNAYLDDYAFLLDALLELLQCRWRNDDLRFAVRLADALLAHFEDREQGGFFFTSDDHEQLIQRPKPFADNATPSGNGIAARALLRLGRLLGNTDYLDAAERCLRAAWGLIEETPWACCTLLDALDEFLDPGRQIVIRGDREAARPWLEVVHRAYRPKTLSILIPPDSGDPHPALAVKNARADGQPVAWVCEGSNCLPAITDLGDFTETIDADDPEKS